MHEATRRERLNARCKAPPDAEQLKSNLRKQDGTIENSLTRRFRSSSGNDPYSVGYHQNCSQALKALNRKESSEEKEDRHIREENYKEVEFSSNVDGLGLR